MKKNILILLSIIASLPTWGGTYFSDWSLVMAGRNEGNEIRSYERLIKTPQSTYSVAAITLMKNAYSGERTVTSVKDFLSKEFKLSGLSQMTLGSSYRFEGYSSELRRQVVIYVSFSGNFIKVSSAFYRPTYGRKVAVEIELWHRLYHPETKVSKNYFKNLPHLFSFISEAHAQTDCTQCAGNPMCLLLCNSANGNSGGGAGGSVGGGAGGGTGGLGGLFGGAGGLGGIDFSGLQGQLAETNIQLTTLNGNLGDFNVNHAETNAQIGQFNTNFNTFNNNHEETNQQLAEANANLVNLTNVFDKRSQEALEESQAWREMTQKESEAWREMADKNANRAMTLAEKMSDPKYLFKAAAFTAAGAVIGSSVANLAITGVTKAIGFLAKWASGELHNMKQQELLEEFAKAMRVYDQSSLMALELEKSIDSILANIELHKKFQLSNSDVLANIQRYIISTKFEIEDATKDRCVDKLVLLNQKLVEFQSLAKILDMVNPQQKMCQDLKEIFRKLAEAEGMLQNARPNLIKAEAALVEKKSDDQNAAADSIRSIQKNKSSRKVSNLADKQREQLYEQNIKDSKKLRADVIGDCHDSFKVITMKTDKKILKSYCESLLTNTDSRSSDFGLKQTFPDLSQGDQKLIQDRFKLKYIALGIDKHQTYEKERETIFNDFEAESDRHKEEVRNLKDRVQLDPKVALNEIKAINQFVERIMKEQAYLYSNGIKSKEAKFEEACQSVNP